MSTRFGRFAVDSARRLLLRDGAEAHLTPKAFDLLALLVAEAPRVVRKDELHQRLWPGTFVSDATLMGLVKELRRVLDDHDVRTPIIRTAHGVGYACAAPIEPGLQRPTPVSRWIVVGSRRIALAEGENASRPPRSFSTSAACHVVMRRLWSVNVARHSKISAAKWHTNRRSGDYQSRLAARW